MSLYAEYVKEVDCGRKIIEIPEQAFITYFIHAPERECYIEDMYIRPSIRGSGLFKKLLSSVEEIARYHGCETITHGVVKKHKAFNRMEELSKVRGYQKHSETETEVNFIKELKHG